MVKESNFDWSCQMDWPPHYACPPSQKRTCSVQASDRCVTISFQAAMNISSCNQEFRDRICSRITPRAQLDQGDCSTECAPVHSVAHRRLQSSVPHSSTLDITVHLEAPSASSVKPITTLIVDVLSTAESASDFFALQVTTDPEMRPEPVRRAHSEPVAAIAGSCGGVAALLTLAVLALVLRKSCARTFVCVCSRVTLHKAARPVTEVRTMRRGGSRETVPVPVHT